MSLNTPGGGCAVPHRRWSTTRSARGAHRGCTFAFRRQTPCVELLWVIQDMAYFTPQGPVRLCGGSRSNLLFLDTGVPNFNIGIEFTWSR